LRNEKRRLLLSKPRTKSETTHRIHQDNIDLTLI
jgi:hypothetical protein